MYRELGQGGVQFGLRQGPYAGGPRTFALADLPADVVERLRLALGGAGHPEPVLRRPLGSRRAAWPEAAAATALVGALAGLAQVGFATAEGLRQGVAAAGLYAVGAAGAAVAARRGWQRARRGLPTGVYLLPLDVVEVSHDAVTVTPLGGVRRVTIEDDTAGPVLSLLFAHGARFAFPVGSEREAEVAHERLEKSQEMLESLSRTTDLEHALDLDPFFSLRGTGSTGQDARGWDLDPPSRRRVAGSWALVALAGAAAGVGAWTLRNQASDQLLFARAVEASSIPAYESYLAVGRLRRAQASFALGQLQEKAARAEADARFHEAEAARNNSDNGCHRQNALAPVDDPLQCFQLHRERLRPEVLELLEERIGTDYPLQVGFRDRPGTAPLGKLDHDARGQLVYALQQAFNQAFASGTVHVHQVGPEAADVVVDTLRSGSSEMGTYAFDVKLALPGHPKVFRLTMPPPERPLDSVRDRSLFRLTPVVPGASPAAVDSIARQALAARAYDRLYDELFGLFFPGDPRVPLR